MNRKPRPSAKKKPPTPRFQSAPKYLLRPVPLPVLQPLFTRIVETIAKRQPQLFSRLEGHSQKTFLIDPINLPFVLMLIPDPLDPKCLCLRRRAKHSITPDAIIAGSFLNLMTLLDGKTDSDALFFGRNITVSGDTEAAVALRNALDDLDRTLIDEVADCFGPLSGLIRRGATRLETLQEKIQEKIQETASHDTGRL